jgi:hypothetical protein
MIAIIAWKIVFSFDRASPFVLPTMLVSVGPIFVILAPPGFVGQTVATILCGGNLTPEQTLNWLSR